MSSNPDETDQNNNNFVPPSVGPEHFDSLDTSDVHIGDIDEMFNSFGNAIDNGPISDMYKISQKLGRQYIEPSDPVTDDQITQFNKEAPGVNIPKGTKLNVAKLLTQDQLQQNRRDLVSNLSKPGLLSGSSRFLGATLGTLSDPVGLAASYFAPELVGMEKGFTSEALGDTALQQLGSGAAIGAGQAAPQSILQQFKNEQFNKQWSSVQAALNIGSNAFIGGALNYGGHVLSSFIKGRVKSPLEDPQEGTVEEEISKFKPFGQTDSDSTMQSATNQMTFGKDPNIKEILQTSLASNHKNLLESLDPYTPQDAVDALEKSKDTVMQNIQSNKDDHDAISSQIDEALKGDDEDNIKSLQSNLSNLSLESIDLQNQLDNHNSMLDLIRNGYDDVTPGDLDNYVKNLNTTSGNFSNSGGYDPEIDLGDEPENINTLNNDEFSSEYKKQLIDEGLIDDEQKQLNSINLTKKNKSSYSKMLNDMINCIIGEANV